MIILIAGASHTGKTLLAQRILEAYGYPYLSIDHLKMGLIRSGNTMLTPMSDDNDLTEYLWPIVCEMIKTAVENKQNLIIEGCYIPFDWKNYFTEEYLSQFPDGLVFVNVTRGEIAPEAVLLKLYRSGKLFGLGLDTFGGEAGLTAVLRGQKAAETENEKAGAEIIRLALDRSENFYVQPHQGFNSDRTIEETLNTGWELLRILPRSELKRIKDEYLNKYL